MKPSEQPEVSIRGRTLTVRGRAVGTLAGPLRLLLYASSVAVVLRCIFLALLITLLLVGLQAEGLHILDAAHHGVDGSGLLGSLLKFPRLARLIRALAIYF